MVFMWAFLDCDSAKKSAVLTRAITDFSWGTENQTFLQTSVKMPGQKLVIFACEWEGIVGERKCNNRRAVGSGVFYAVCSEAP
jgi:hypothetical protein